MTERRQTTPLSDGAKSGAKSDAPPRRDRAPEGRERGRERDRGAEAQDGAREPAPGEADPLSRDEARGFDKRRRFME